MSRALIVTAPPAGRFLQAHSGPITGIDLLPQPDGSILMVSTAGDADMRVWRWQHSSTAGAGAGAAAGISTPADVAGARALGQAHWQLQQAIHVGTKIQHCVALTVLPHDPSW
jgi:hypothetical protein